MVMIWRDVYHTTFHAFLGICIFIDALMNLFCVIELYICLFVEIGRYFVNAYTRYECTTIEISFLFLLSFMSVLLVRQFCHYPLYVLLFLQG